MKRLQTRRRPDRFHTVQGYRQRPRVALVALLLVAASCSGSDTPTEATQNQPAPEAITPRPSEATVEPRSPDPDSAHSTATQSPRDDGTNDASSSSDDAAVDGSDRASQGADVHLSDVLERSGAEPDVAACYATVLGDAGDFETLDELNRALLALAPSEQAALAQCAPQGDTAQTAENGATAAADEPSPGAKLIADLLIVDGMSTSLAGCYAGVLDASAGALATRGEIDAAVQDLSAKARQAMQRCASIYPA